MPECLITERLNRLALMNSLNVDTKQIREATDFLVAEITSLPLLTNVDPAVRQEFLLSFANQQRRSGLTGYALSVQARFTASEYGDWLSGNPALSVWERVWLTYLLSRALLIACGCYGPDAFERTLHWQYYKPLLALLRGYGHSESTARDYRREAPYLLPVSAFSIN